jgi:hypothetical protein
MFEVGKEYKTESGKTARIYALDGTCGRIHGAIRFPEGWMITFWEKNGKSVPSCENNLILPRKPAKITAAVINAINAVDTLRNDCGYFGREMAVVIIEAWRDEGCPEEE